MDANFDYLFTRRVPLHYQCPPFCEADFSSTSFPIIVLNPIARRRKVTGLEYVVIDGRVFLRWGTYPGAFCFSVYKAVDSEDPFGAYVLVAECVTPDFEILTPGVYVITAITPDGETEFSDPLVVPDDAFPPIPETCDQDGPAIPEFPDPLYDDTGTPQDLGNISVPIGGLFLGDFLPGSFALSYVEGAYKKSNPAENPCPGQDFSWPAGTVNPASRFVTSSSSAIVPPQNPSAGCNNSEAEVEAALDAFYIGSPPNSVTVQHAGGNVNFVNNFTGLIDGSPAPTYHIVFTPSVPAPTQKYLIEDFVNIGPRLVHPDWIDSLLTPAWDGEFGDDIQDFISTTFILRHGAGEFDCSTSERIGNKKVFWSAVQGPIQGSQIRDTLNFEFPANPEFLNYGDNLVLAGQLDPDAFYWVLDVWDCCHGVTEDQCEPHFYGWYGVKEYGLDVDGNYRKLYGGHPDAPLCVTVTPV